MMTATGQEVPAGFSRYGYSIALPHSNGLTLTFPWWAIILTAAGAYYFIERR